MTTTQRPPVALPGRPGGSVLTVAAVISLFALTVALVGLGVDGRTITGAPAWLKPAKFGISIVVYTLTLTWMLTSVTRHRVAVRVIGWVTAICLAGELVLIDLQVVRGTTSHFNSSTAFDGAVFSAMGMMISLVFLGCVGASVLLVRERSLDRTLGAGIRAGLFVCALGMAEAGLMLANGAVHPAGAHTVGAADGGPGLPIVGWSTQHGDLRVAHFVGLHALQVLPLLAWLLLRYGGSCPQPTRILLVRLAAAAWLGLVVILAWQAERGLPLLHPDTVIATAGGALALVTAGCVAVTVRRGGAAPESAHGSASEPR